MVIASRLFVINLRSKSFVKKVSDSHTGMPLNNKKNSIAEDCEESVLRGFAQQKTLKESVSCQGIGLHTGNQVKMTLHPAAANTGIVFVRSDIGEDAYVDASWRNVTETRRATTISNEAGHHVSTIEHLMAGLAGCGIDNILVEINAPEVPVMDGSAEPFVSMIEGAGVILQSVRRKAIVINKTIRVGNRDSFISLNPASTFGVSFEIEFCNSTLASQALDMKLVNGTFKDEIASARTFGFAYEVDALKKAGLALGGSLDNAIVIEDDNVLNQDGLRYHNELVRHKILDCVGDLYLAGAPIIGQVDAVRSGHALNHELLCTLFSNSDTWSISELSAAVVPGIDNQFAEMTH